MAQREIERGGGGEMQVRESRCRGRCEELGGRPLNDPSFKEASVPMNSRSSLLFNLAIYSNKQANFHFIWPI